MLISTDDMHKISLQELHCVIKNNATESAIINELSQYNLSDELINLVISEFHHEIGINVIFQD